jgi:hypothetical protein
MTANEESNNQKDGSKKGLFIGFIIILLGINGYQYFLSTQDKKLIEEKAEIIEVKSNENTLLVAKADSLEEEINKQIAQYEQLGIENKELVAVKEKLEKEKRRLLADAGYKSKFLQSKKELDDLKSMLSENGGEIEKIKVQRDSLFAANNMLKEDKNKLYDTITQINAKTSVLEQKVKLASKLIALNVKTTVINKKSKELDEPIYKAKNIDKLNIKFNYADNKVADIGGRTIYLRVIEPDGATLQEAGSSGSFFSEGQEITYTAKQDHLFDNSQKAVAFLFSKAADQTYKPGKYLVEIYTDIDKSGEGSFIVK